MWTGHSANLRRLCLLHHGVLIDHVCEVRHIERISDGGQDFAPLDERHCHHALRDRGGDLKEFHRALLHKRLGDSLHAVRIDGNL